MSDVQNTAMDIYLSSYIVKQYRGDVPTEVHIHPSDKEYYAEGGFTTDIRGITIVWDDSVTPGGYYVQNRNYGRPL